MNPVRDCNGAINKDYLKLVKYHIKIISNGVNKKILIVEDDKDFLWILKESFNGEDFDIVYATDGEQGLDMAEKEKPDLFILDIKLPGMDGISVAKKLKERGNKAPIIFLTNLSDPEHISQAMETTKETEYIIKSDLHMDQVVSAAKKKLGM